MRRAKLRKRDRFKLMRMFIRRISELDSGLVFKGGTILDEILQSTDLPQDMERETVDVDIDWTKDEPTMEYLERLVSAAAKRMNPVLTANVQREYNGRYPARFGILYKGVQLFSVDICIEPNSYYVYYRINGKRVRGQSVEKIIADKVSVLASAKIERRIKDFYDLYALTFIKRINSGNIWEILDKTRNGRLGGFGYFLDNTDGLEARYKSMRGIQNRPIFITVYNKVLAFVQPFIQHNKSDHIWDGYQWIQPMQYAAKGADKHA